MLMDIAALDHPCYYGWLMIITFLTHNNKSQP